MDQAADIETYFSFITEDFAWIGDRDDGGIRGREELRAFLEPFFEMTDFSVARWATDDLIFSGNGNQAVHIFTGEVVLEDKASGDRTAIDRTYVDFWSKQPDGKWLCTRHTFVVLGVREL
jgi:ketosteroid isomerase-like protein